MTYLIKKTFTIDGNRNVNYYDWYLGKFVENEDRTPLEKLYTKHFTSLDKVIKLLNKNKNNELFKNAKIVGIEI